MPVYMIRAGDSGPVKIGFARDPIQRLDDLQVAHYEALTLLRIWEGGFAEEALLHARFADLAIRGEWFAFSRAMLADVGLVRVRIRVPPPTTDPQPRLTDDEILALTKQYRANIALHWND